MTCLVVVFVGPTPHVGSAVNKEEEEEEVEEEKEEKEEEEEEQQPPFPTPTNKK